MRKMLLLGVLLLVAGLLLSGCSNPEETDADPSPTEVPTQAAPTFVAPTAVPTITGKPMAGPVEWPEADATLMEIDPIDKPTPPPLQFGDYHDYESGKLRVAFKIPTYFGDPANEGDESTNDIIFTEPEHSIKSGVEGGAAVFTIRAITTATVQTFNDASNMLDTMIDALRDQYPEVKTSSKAKNRVLSIEGPYVTIWVERPINPEEEDSPTVSLRGRCLVVPVDKRLYVIEYLCPVDFNGDYEDIYKQIRDSFREL